MPTDVTSDHVGYLQAIVGATDINTPFEKVLRVTNVTLKGHFKHFNISKNRTVCTIVTANVRKEKISINNTLVILVNNVVPLDVITAQYGRILGSAGTSPFILYEKDITEYDGIIFGHNSDCTVSRNSHKWKVTEAMYVDTDRCRKIIFKNSLFDFSFR